MDRVNYLNIGLMLAACGVALFVPFELFLFAYAVLGPAHYLTEISWLEKRSFFTKRRSDVWILLVLAALAFLTPAPSATQSYSLAFAVYTAVAFGGALVLVLTDRGMYRAFGMAAVIGLSLLVLNLFGPAAALMGLFVPTLVHVYVFTGIFMLFGALKEKSTSGYAAFAVFLICPLLCVLLDPVRWEPGPFVVVRYWLGFSHLNLAVLGIDVPRTRAEGGAAGFAVFQSAAGFALMRFVAFAYTYHYFNWFSKTSIIKWHEAGTHRLAAVALLWVGAVGVYAYDYVIGVRVLFCLSLLHVYLEFPLNHVSILGTYRELRSRLAGSGL